MSELNTRGMNWYGLGTLSDGCILQIWDIKLLGRNNVGGEVVVQSCLGIQMPLEIKNLYVVNSHKQRSKLELHAKEKLYLSKVCDETLIHAYFLFFYGFNLEGS